MEGSGMFWIIKLFWGNLISVTKMAVTELPCLNSDKDFKVADSGFALTQVYKKHFS